MCTDNEDKFTFLFKINLRDNEIIVKYVINIAIVQLEERFRLGSIDVFCEQINKSN